MWMQSFGPVTCRPLALGLPPAPSGGGGAEKHSGINVISHVRRAASSVCEVTGLPVCGLPPAPSGGGGGTKYFSTFTSTVNRQLSTVNCQLLKCAKIVIFPRALPGLPIRGCQPAGLRG